MALTPVPTTTTLGADLAQTAITATFASTTGFVATQGNTGLGTQLVIGAEIVNVLSVVNSTVATIERGVGGTAAAFHPNGTTVTYGLSSSLGPQLASSFQQVAIVTASGATATAPYVGPYITTVGGSRVDPNTGYVYTLVNCNQAMSIGEWVAIDASGVAGPFTATAKGRVGIIAETIAASQTLTYALTSGSTSSALMTSDVTTACILMAGSSGQVDLLTSTGGNVVYGATCTAAPSSATDLGTAYIHNAWVFGVVVSFSSVGT